MISRNTFRWCICILLLVLGCSITATYAQSNINTQIHYLSGTDNEHTATWQFFCTGGRNSGIWTTIEVPSCWEQQGFGNYDYGRDYRTYGKRFQFSDEKGIYKHQFEVPKDWEGKVIKLVFEGVMTDAEVKINDLSAGDIHQGAFYRFKYDITDKLRFGESNELEVAVSKMSANKSVNRAERFADYWIFGGIFRPVYLEVLPKQHIEHLAIAADAVGQFRADVFTQNIAKNSTLKVSIFDPNGVEVASTEQPLKAAVTSSSITTAVANPLTWTSETPHLYSAKIDLTQDGKIIHAIRETFGFRTVEIRQGDGIYINGTKVKFKGVNRHAFWPETGRTLNRDIDRLDIELMKEMNMNAIRCSHYPPDKSFLELCDSLGLYVLDELAGWQNAYDTTVGEKLVKELVERDVNHPSIVLWSNGNEGGTNKELDDDFLLYDPSQRPVIHAHHKPGNDFNGVETNHYEKYYSTKSILEDSLIYMPTEFLHAQDDGGAAAALEDFWELMWASPRSAGGFLWAFIDEGVVRTDLNGYIDVNRVNAPDGILGPHREKEGSFYALKEIYSPIVIKTKVLSADFKGKLEVENRFHFTNLDQCIFKGELVNFKAPDKREAGHTITKKFELSGPVVKPGKKGALNLNLPSNWRQNDALYLSAFDSKGKVIMKWSWKIRPSESIDAEIQKLLDINDLEEVVVEESDSTLTLSASHVKSIFSKKNGQLLKIEDKSGLNPPFGKGPISPGNELTNSSGHKHYREKDGYVFEYNCDGYFGQIKWKMYPSGLLQLDYTYDATEEHLFAGISFDYPESNIIGVEWLGNGPYRVWKNRMQGGQLDVWTSMYNNTHTGTTPWVYPEFKGYFSDVAWMVFNTVEGKFLVASPDNDLFVRLFDFYGLSGPEPHPALPQGDISFLDAIPPIGTKLATGLDTKTEGLGPLSEWNKPKGPVSRRLYFYFGL